MKRAAAEPVRVLLADDHTLVRAGLRSLLEKIPRVEVVGEAADGREAIALARALKPSVVLMDIAMPSLNGLDATERLAGELPGARVIILSVHTDEEYVLRAMRSGAAGYLLKRSATAELAAALDTVGRGGVYLSPSLSRHVISDYLEGIDDWRSPVEQLTPRQREILQLIAEGETNKGIAHLLHLSIKTVEAHRTLLMKHLDIHDLAGLVRFAIRAGLVPPEG